MDAVEEELQDIKERFLICSRYGRLIPILFPARYPKQAIAMNLLEPALIELFVSKPLLDIVKNLKITVPIILLSRVTSRLI
ncbi:MAG: hypothetical protein ACTSWN_01020 [Promethearchaeota archaeon]